MPLYEYECAACHKRTEKIQKFSDPEMTECPHCGGKLERVLSAPAVSFKGGGWYADLYSSSKKPAAGSGGGDGGSKPAESSPAASSGGESKAAPAPAAAPSSTPAKSS
jgi:putative FmdB family regulatory protein